MRVVSLFDGMGCGIYALKKVGKNPTIYFASEIDKWAIQIAKKNHPQVVHLGCVKQVRKLAETGFFGWVDLIIAGSPCQGFSFAGDQLAFDDPRSVLFFEFLQIYWILRRTNPNIKFMLENVKMKKQHLDVISNFLGVKPVLINSALVSAQNRNRYYWCNWTIEQPADRNIFLKDIIENEPKLALSEGEMNYMNRETKDGRNHWDYAHHSDTDKPKSSAVVANFSRGVPYNVLIDRENVKGGAVRGRYKDDGSTEQGLEIRQDNKANCITTCAKDSVASFAPLRVSEATRKGFAEIPPNCGVDLTFPESKTRRGRKMQHKSNCLTAATYNYGWYNGVFYRKLTPVECERLQTLPDGYTEGVSNSQRYKMLGNGWNAETVAHIFGSMPA